MHCMDKQLKTISKGGVTFAQVMCLCLLTAPFHVQTPIRSYQEYHNHITICYF